MVILELIRVAVYAFVAFIVAAMFFITLDGGQWRFVARDIAHHFGLDGDGDGR